MTTPGIHAFDAPLLRAWYHRPTRQVARELLGCLLAVRRNRAVEAVRIVETEAYVANDPASHAFRGPTPRNRSMYGQPGTLYVYRIHQVHCANVVTRPGEAVLLRAGASLHDSSREGRGPGRLCRWMGIDRGDDGSDLTSGRIRILPRVGASPEIVQDRRVGIRRNPDAPLRYAVRGERSVSTPRPRGWADRGV
ncbi:MAG TPA: DNA-3-methyladenine glycosylase [Thermoplasmata archaeon]|nr:DNA-3-methyladenine glycosylase [Thermoplasmata archaeon]